MQEFVEHLAVMTGEPIYNANGVKNVGRHTWRGMGAIYFSERNLEIYKIQLLARWASPVILHYARAAPLRNITEAVRDLNDINSLGKVIRTLKNDIKHIKANMSGIDGKTQKMLELEVAISNEREKQETSSSPPQYVRNLSTGCYHTIAVGTGDKWKWTTQCTFQFGLAEHERLSEPPADFSVPCHRCFPELRARLKRQADTA